MAWQRRASIGSGVWRLALIAVLGLVLIVVAVQWSLRAVTAQGAEVERVQRIQDDLRELHTALLTAESNQRGFLIALESRYLKPQREGSAQTRRLDQLRLRIRNAEASALFARLRPLAEEKLVLMEQNLALAEAGSVEAALERVRSGEGWRLMQEFSALDGQIAELERRLHEEQRSAFIDRLQGLAGLVLGGGALAVAVLLLLARRTAAKLQQPVNRLLEGIEAMGRGELKHRLVVEAQDEVARIGVAFNAMATQLQLAQQARDQARAELERSNAELDQFAYVASHDLKAPLRGIRSLAGWIAEDLGDAASAEVRENLALLSSRVERLDRLLDSLLSYSRVGRKRVAVEDIELPALLADIVQYQAPPAGMTVRWDGPAVALRSWRAPLETVLRNLVSNAIKHHDRDQGQVLVRASETEPDWLRIEVEDDGPGIAPAFHEKVFGMFQTLRPRDEVEGSGMGLAVVRKTVEHVGGRVWVESAPPQRGSRFLFSWPRRAAETEGSEAV